MARLIPIGLALALAGCEPWKNDSAALTAKATAPVQGTNCAACHAYPLKDINHDDHLFKEPADYKLNGKITCLDCHANSIKSRVVVALDSIYGDDTSGTYHTINRPGDTARTLDRTKRIRDLPLKGIDTLTMNHPVAMPERPGAKPAFQEYVTTLAHMNGKVDVVFDPRNSAPAEFGGDSASYNPRQETCSAVACHPGSAGPTSVYRWAAPSKGLPALPVQE